MLRLWLGPLFLAALVGVATVGEWASAQEAAAVQADSVKSGSAESGGDEVNPAWEAAKLDVLSDLERLREDILVLSALRVLQERLFDWNEALLASGEEVVFLNPGLCEEAEVRVWCELLPVSFGREGGAG